MFLFKQKTAYGMRISDWSSECALPIYILERHRGGDRVPRIGKAMDEIAASFEHLDDMARNRGGGDRQIARRQPLRHRHQIGGEAHRFVTPHLAGRRQSVV